MSELSEFSEQELQKELERRKKASETARRLTGRYFRENAGCVDTIVHVNGESPEDPELLSVTILEIQRSDKGPMVFFGSSEEADIASTLRPEVVEVTKQEYDRHIIAACNILMQKEASGTAGMQTPF